MIIKNNKLENIVAKMFLNDFTFKYLTPINVINKNEEYCHSNPG